MLTPMTTEVEVKAGTQHTGVLTITHELPQGVKATDVPPLKLRVYAADWTLDRQGNLAFSKPGTVQGSCTSWLQLNPLELEIPAGEKRDARYTLNIPADAQGTFHTVVMFETAPEPRKEGDRTVAVNGRIGATLYAHVGPQSKRARISGFAMTPEKSVLTLENTGTSHVRFNGKLQFKNESGQMVLQAPLPSGVVLPGKNNVREIVMDTPKLPASGKYSVTAVVDYGGEVLIGARAQVSIP